MALDPRIVVHTNWFMLHTSWQIVQMTSPSPILWGHLPPTLSHGWPHDRPYHRKKVNEGTIKQSRTYQSFPCLYIHVGGEGGGMAALSSNVSPAAAATARLDTGSSRAFLEMKSLRWSTAVEHEDRGVY